MITIIKIIILTVITTTTIIIIIIITIINATTIKIIMIIIKVIERPKSEPLSMEGGPLGPAAHSSDDCNNYVYILAFLDI